MNFNDIYNKNKINRDYAYENLKSLYNYKIPILCDRPLLAIKTHIIIPYELEVNDNKIIKENNKYKFVGLPGNRLIFANNSMPFSYSHQKLYTGSIPFSFPIITGDTIKKVEILSSNVYYFEITILNTINVNNTWDSQCVSIGFAKKDTPFNSHPGWYNNSVGFHSDDGTIRYNSTGISRSYSRRWAAGDTAGAGIIYVDKTTIKPFFTFNGKLLYTGNDIKMSAPYYPVVGYDHPNSIKLNFSNEKFVFNAKDFILHNSNYVISCDNVPLFILPHITLIPIGLSYNKN